MRDTVEAMQRAAEYGVSAMAARVQSLCVSHEHLRADLEAAQQERDALKNCGRTVGGYCFNCVTCLGVLLKDADEQSEQLQERIKRIEGDIGRDVIRAVQQAQQERDALKAIGPHLLHYIEWSGPVHAEQCPGDDTCDCLGKEMNDAANALAKLLAPPPPEEPTR
jgi:hypothetical protein